jgi:hypothetical protein
VRDSAHIFAAVGFDAPGAMASPRPAPTLSERVRSLVLAGALAPAVGMLAFENEDLRLVGVKPTGGRAVETIVRGRVQGGMSVPKGLWYRIRACGSRCQQWFKWLRVRPDQPSAEFWNWPK